VQFSLPDWAPPPARPRAGPPSSGACARNADGAGPSVT